MEWTTKPPTEPGWYWIRHVNRHNGRGALIQLGMYSKNKKGMCYLSVLDVLVVGALEHRKFTHWQGPLPEPEPPD